MIKPIESKPGAGAIIIVPAWHTSGSFEVFKGQIRTLTLLGFETYVLAASHYWMAAPRYEDFRRDYRLKSASLGATMRDEVRFPESSDQKLDAFKASCAGRTEAYRGIQCAVLMDLPKSLAHFVRGKRELFVLCNHYFNVPLVNKLEVLLGRPLKFALETHDIQSRHYRQRDPAMTECLYQRMLNEEMDIAAKSDWLIHLSEEEHPVFAKALPAHTHQLVFPSITARWIEAGPRCATTFLVVASYNDPNADSIAWFLTEVWSRYDGKGTLKIVGNVDQLMATRHPEVFARWGSLFTGRVEDLADLYRTAAVVVIPVVIGEGIAIKFAEAMAFGKYVLFTPRAVRGVPERCVAHVERGLCENADAMIAKMQEFSDATDVRVSRGSLKVYRELFSQERHTVAYHRVTRAMTNDMGSL